MRQPPSLLKIDQETLIDFFLLVNNQAVADYF